MPYPKDLENGLFNFWDEIIKQSPDPSETGEKTYWSEIKNPPFGGSEVYYLNPQVIDFVPMEEMDGMTVGMIELNSPFIDDEKYTVNYGGIDYT